jgi:hypothetical protein
VEDGKDREVLLAVLPQGDRKTEDRNMEETCIFLSSIFLSL